MVLCLAEGDTAVSGPERRSCYLGVDVPDREEDEAGEKAHLCDVGNDLEVLVCKAAAQATLGL